MTPDEVTREVRRIEITTRHLVRDLLGRHGTGTASKIRWRSASGPTPSASAR